MRYARRSPETSAAAPGTSASSSRSGRRRAGARASMSLPELVARGDETALLAGGTDFFVERHVAPVADGGTPRPLVADVSRLDELRAIEIDGAAARIGAAATYLEIRRHPVLAERAPLLGAM